jgi:hypothetical protein
VPPLLYVVLPVLMGSEVGRMGGVPAFKHVPLGGGWVAFWFFTGDIALVF